MSGLSTAFFKLRVRSRKARKQTANISDLGVNEVLHELSECREDERNSQNQMLQVISAAGAIIGFCAALATFEMDKINQPEMRELVMRLLLILTSFVLCTAFSYITFLGISNVLRYHYLQSLEDRLTQLLHKNKEQNALLHWMSLSSPVLTKNPTHLKTKYAYAAYGSYAMATLSAVIFGLITIAIEAMNITNRKWFDYLLIGVPTVFIIISFYIFIVISIHADDMFRTALEIAKNKRGHRLMQKRKQNGAVPRKKYLQALLYLTYPKRKDAQKAMLILIGAVTGIFMLYGSLPLEFIIAQLGAQFKNIMCTWFVIDVLVYQSRYQWNDIRGVKEDAEAGKTDRLPTRTLGTRPAIILSSIFIALKLLLASYIGISCQREYLLWFTGLIVVLAIAYEIARQRESNKWIFILVGLGYPLRFFAGLFSVYPAEKFDLKSLSVYASLGLAYMAFGGYEAILPWTYEALMQCNEPQQYFIKSYYEPLYISIKERIPVEQAYAYKIQALRKTGKITDLWNVMFLSSITILSGYLVLYLLLSNSSASSYLVLLEVVFAIAVLTVCCGSVRNILKRLFFAIVCIILKGGLVTLLIGWIPTYICICVHQLFFLTVYYYLRFKFDPSFDCFNLICRTIIGRQTF